MDEDLETEEQSAEMPIEGMDLQALAGANPTLAPFMSKYFGAMEAESTALQKQAANRQKQFEAAEAAIREKRFGAPTTSEQLFALGAALLAPRRYTGFAGTLDKIAPVFGQMDQLQRSAAAQRADALEKLRREYLLGADESAVAAARAQREGLGRILPSVASASGTANRARFAVETNPTTGVPTFKNFDVPVAAVNALLYALNQPGATEQQKTATMQAFEAQFRVPASTFIEGVR
jgi:hypothetical protein